MYLVIDPSGNDVEHTKDGRIIIKVSPHRSSVWLATVNALTMEEFERKDAADGKHLHIGPRGAMSLEKY